MKEKFSERNTSAVLEYPFDFKRYTEQRLREIDDLDERRFAKRVLLEGLGNVIRYTEQKYRELEKRIYEEVRTVENRYETAMTIVRREHYDPTNPTLYPVCGHDLEPEKLAAELSGSEKLYLGTIFLELNEAEQREFERYETFSGFVRSEDGRKEALFHISRTGRYRAAIGELYQIFLDNHVPWETVNTGYLDKFYDVFLVLPHDDGPESTEAGCVLLRDAEIEFGSFSSCVRYDRIPLWNMEWVRFDGNDFMFPCMDGIYYEHEFSLADKTQKDGYLVQANEEILEIRHEKDRIVMKSEKETFESWRILHIIQSETVRSLDYDAPLLTNHRRDSFIRRYSESSGVRLMTKADLMRRIMELDVGDFIEAVGYEIDSDTKAYPLREGMNWFMQDELFPLDGRKVLVLKFEEKQPGHYLNDSMVRFVISGLQTEISEYRCVGVIV